MNQNGANEIEGEGSQNAEKAASFETAFAHNRGINTLIGKRSAMKNSLLRHPIGRIGGQINDVLCEKHPSKRYLVEILAAHR
jgi:hypothetical protein